MDIKDLLRFEAEKLLVEHETDKIKAFRIPVLPEDGPFVHYHFDIVRVDGVAAYAKCEHLGMLVFPPTRTPDPAPGLR